MNFTSEQKKLLVYIIIIVLFLLVVYYIYITYYSEQHGVCSKIYEQLSGLWICPTPEKYGSSLFVLYIKNDLYESNQYQMSYDCYLHIETGTQILYSDYMQLIGDKQMKGVFTSVQVYKLFPSLLFLDIRNGILYITDEQKTMDIASLQKIK